MTVSRLFLWGACAIAGLTFLGAVAAGAVIMSRNRGSDDDVIKSRELIRQALETFEAGDVATSRSLTERVLAISPAEPLARANLGRIYKGQGDYARAIAEHKLALVADPDLPDLYYNIACYYALAKRKDDALRWLALALAHGFARLEHLRGDADLESLEGDPRFELLARTGKLATGVPRIRLQSSSYRVAPGTPFEISLVAERELPAAQADSAAGDLTVLWRPEPPVEVLSEDLRTTATPGDGFVSLRTVARWVVQSREEGLLALPPARVTVVVDGTETVVVSDAFAVEIVPGEGDEE